MTIKKRLGIIYSVTFILMLAVNYLTATDVGMVADENPAIIQPAGYVFSIWGVIYLLLFVWIVRMFFKHNDSDRVYESIHYWLVANFILNGLWIIAFTQLWYLTSVIIIIGLLVTLFVIYKKISHVSINWFDRVPFSIYFGWGTVATIVNIVTWVKEMGVEEVVGFNEYQWTLALLIIGTGIAVFVSLVHHDWLYPLVFAWAFAGIIVRNDYEMFWLTVVCGVSILIHLGISLYTGIKRARR
ncbi:TspO and MBR related proteins [Alkalibacterium putridalgicola]|uniref:Tryptophan-rich sensory protein n=1 Tax=Alkalibacterium putridalgicola TaxID=426703 RepID=A0A1H7TQB5_9LACT|nr:tryptophan-rich sensory protein [Alkalibacterium putridalgicola]GEK88197.1 tryptophan-rich sensory protein [Alkalibacterium putridalgicola]SEL86057.1 TspO and MBR related proteins [Alkalibacterium putridalgicola]